MNAKHAIKSAIESSDYIFNMYLSDLSDADLLVRPVPGANHIAWQLGHLIDSEKNFMGKYIPGSAYPETPLRPLPAEARKPTSPPWRWH